VAKRPSDQGCQIFLGPIYQSGKNTPSDTKLPNDRKIFHINDHKVYPNWDENIVSGKPVENISSDNPVENIPSGNPASDRQLELGSVDAKSFPGIDSTKLHLCRPKTVAKNCHYQIPENSVCTDINLYEYNGQ
jgi:hypothetical protein